MFGFEESYGYLRGTFVRDKDAVIASMLICEMTLYYKKKGLSLYDALMKLYEKYGFYKEELVSINLMGKEGQKQIGMTIDKLRHVNDLKIEGLNISKKYDYKMGVEKDIINGIEKKINLPTSNVLKFVLENGDYFVIRPSGTEPKMKIYMGVKGENLENSKENMLNFKEKILKLVENMRQNLK